MEEVSRVAGVCVPFCPSLRQPALPFSPSPLSMPPTSAPLLFPLNWPLNLPLPPLHASSQIDAWLGIVADHVDEVVLVAVVCVPFALYYASFALTSRIMPKWASTANVTADEWLLVLSIFFVLGR